MKPFAKDLHPLHSLWALALFACAARQQVIEMDPIELRARHTKEGVKVEFMDPEALFLSATKDYEEGRCEDAIARFGLVVEAFPNSSVAKASLFNRGLALLRCKMPKEAAKDFEQFVNLYPEDPDVKDALKKQGEALVEAGEGEKAIRPLQERLALEPLSLMEEVEVRAYLASALRQAGRFDECRKEVERVVDLYDKNLDRPEMARNYYVAMASYQGASVWHDLFSRIKFVLPVERMEKDLIDKATLFLKAQSEYLRTIRIGNTYWGVKAGVAIGRMYEEFFDHIMEAEVPKDLSEEDLKVYYDELKRKAKPLLAKALETYERNLSIAKMYGARDEWFGDTLERIVRLRRELQKIPDEPTWP